MDLLHVGEDFCNLWIFICGFLYTFFRNFPFVDFLRVAVFSLANFSTVRIRNCGLLAFLGLIFAKSLSVRPTRADFSFVLNIVLADYSADILNGGLFPVDGLGYHWRFLHCHKLADLCAGGTMRGKAEGQREGDAGTYPHLPGL